MAESYRLWVKYPAVLQAGEVSVAKVKAKMSREVVETVDNAFTRHKKEEWDRSVAREAKKKAAPRAEAAQYSAAMIESAHALAFQRMPLFRNRKYARFK